MPSNTGPPPGHYAPPPPGQYPSYPQPSNSGTLNLDSIKPVTSGTVSLEAAIAKAKAVAAANNIAPYERAPVYGGAMDGQVDGHRHWGRSRSRSPQSRRDNNFRDANSYRDETRPSRDYGHHARDRSYSPGPRGRHSGAPFSPRGGNPARQRSPLRGTGDNDSETMEIEASLVGLIIGRQGENLRRVEAETKCRVQFLPPQSKEEKFRQCKITGPRASRAEATSAINRIIEDSGMGAIARAGLDRGGRPAGPNPVVDRGGVANLKDGEDCVQIMVPDRTVGLIIGRGGETIRDLQERSGCHVNIVGEQKSVNGLRPVNLIGPYAATAQAKEMIMEIVDSDSRNANGGGASAGGSAPPQGRNPRDDREKVQDAIFVPNEAVGMIIGKGGETIREMQNSTGCKINVSQQPQPGQSEREIELVGSRDAINQAKAAIEDKVEAVVSTSAFYVGEWLLTDDTRGRRATVAVSVIVEIVVAADVEEISVTMTALAVPRPLTTSTQAETGAHLQLRLPSLVLKAKLTPMHPVSIYTTVSLCFTTCANIGTRWWIPELSGSVVPVVRPERRDWRSGRCHPAPWNVVIVPRATAAAKCVMTAAYTD